MVLSASAETCGDEELLNFRFLRALSALIVLLFFTLSATAQVQRGTVRGNVSDSTGAVVAEVDVTLANPISEYRRAFRTKSDGQFEFQELAYGAYVLEVKAQGFASESRMIVVRTNVPQIDDVQLRISTGSAQVMVRSNVDLDMPTSTVTTMDAAFVAHMPLPTIGNVQSVLGTVQGWHVEDNGLLHERGVDDGALFIVNGVPMPDRRDMLFASSLQLNSISSMQVVSGNTQAEFGGRSGAVILVDTKSGFNLPPSGSFAVSAGGFHSLGTEASTSGGNSKLGYFVAGSSQRSDRFLDPVDPNNLHDIGTALQFSGRGDWNPNSHDALVLTASVDGANFGVPNTRLQESAGQNIQQRNRDYGATLMWQRVWNARTVSNISVYSTSFHQRLLPSDFDTPITATQDRKHTRFGTLAALSYSRGMHLIKAGMALSRVRPDEFFSFSVTDPEAAAEAELSDAAMQFTAASPFVFRGRATGLQSSFYVQDTLTPFQHLTLDLGLRFERSSLLVTDQQVSPRIGAAYWLSGTGTSLRASFNRMFMPPQVENLLLASSEQARQLSPFASDVQPGGAPIHAERVSAFEVGFTQQLPIRIRLDVAWWSRQFRNFDDPNVFFSSTLIFPNSVDHGNAHGVDARLDLPKWHGIQSYISYANTLVRQVGPINGGLFLTDDFLDIQKGTVFTPDHDERNSGAFGMTYSHPQNRFWLTWQGSYASGTPIEVDPDSIDSLRESPGAQLVDFDRMRVKPRFVIAAAVSVRLVQKERIGMSLGLSVQNLANVDYVYNFGNPFSGTHFGCPRTVATRVRFDFK